MEGFVSLNLQALVKLFDVLPPFGSSLVKPVVADNEIDPCG